jgi:hypothetical protein
MDEATRTKLDVTDERAKQEKIKPHAHMLGCLLTTTTGFRCLGSACGRNPAFGGRVGARASGRAGVEKMLLRAMDVALGMGSVVV